MFIDARTKPSTQAEMATYIAAAYRLKPNTHFLVRGDKLAIYADVLQAMVIMKNAGVETVNLVTEPLPQ